MGILVPRTDTSSIITPTDTGLLIYQTSDNTFYYFNGLQWVGIQDEILQNSLIDSDDDSYILVEIQWMEIAYILV